jgi:hypothetical protein
MAAYGHSFPFTNTGEYPVTISSTRSSYGCVVAALEKKRYEPGESGKSWPVSTSGIAGIAGKKPFLSAAVIGLALVGSLAPSSSPRKAFELEKARL